MPVGLACCEVLAMTFESMLDISIAVNTMTR
jgi:hypothetical protein